MNNLSKLVVLACLSMTSQLSFAQNIVLINGQASEVVLSGEDLKNIVNNRIDDYLDGFDQEPQSSFQRVPVRVETSESLATKSTPTEEEIKDSELPLISLVGDKPRVEDK